MQQCIFSIGTRDIVAIPPTDRIRTSHLEVSRDRVLTQEELRYLLVALEAHPNSAFDRSAAKPRK